MICPNGHESAADDFCDTCGAKIDLAAQPVGSVTGAAGTTQGGASTEAPGDGEGAAAPDGQLCPNCQTLNTVDALFCEACGYDFTTGVLPRGAAQAVGAPTEEEQPAAAAPEAAVPASGGPVSGTAAGVATPPSVAPPIPLEWVAEVWVDPEWYSGQDAEEPLPSMGLPQVVPLLVRSVLVGRVSASRNIHPEIDCATDTGVSRRHAQLTTDGARWFVEDLGSSNGTYVGPASGPLPEDPIAVGPRTELDADDRVYVGAWTRIVVRSATDDEKAAAVTG